MTLESPPVVFFVSSAGRDTAPDDLVLLFVPGNAGCAATAEALFAVPVHGRWEENLVVCGEL